MVAVLFERTDDRIEIIVGGRLQSVMEFAHIMGLVPEADRRIGTKEVPIRGYELTRVEELQEWLNEDHKAILAHAIQSIQTGFPLPYWIGIVS